MSQPTPFRMEDSESPAALAAAIGEAVDRDDPASLRAMAEAIECCPRRMRADRREVCFTAMGEAQHRAVVRALRQMADRKS